MKTSAIILNSFLDGFTLDGLFGWAKLPGSATTFCEEDCDLVDSKFADLFLGHLPYVPTLEGQELEVPAQEIPAIRLFALEKRPDINLFEEILHKRVAERLKSRYNPFIDVSEAETAAEFREQIERWLKVKRDIERLPDLEIEQQRPKAKRSAEQVKPPTHDK